MDFNQPSTSSITLNRVAGTSKSLIDGMINANGQVFILNPNGIIQGKGTSVNTSGILMSTLDISDADFADGNFVLEGSSTASIIKKGAINVADSGHATLIANSLSNVESGVIKAEMGKINLAAGEKITLNLSGNSLVNLVVERGQLDSIIYKLCSLASRCCSICITS